MHFYSKRTAALIVFVLYNFLLQVCEIAAEMKPDFKWLVQWLTVPTVCHSS